MDMAGSCWLRREGSRIARFLRNLGWQRDIDGKRGIVILWRTGGSLFCAIVTGDLWRSAFIRVNPR